MSDTLLFCCKAVACICLWVALFGLLCFGCRFIPILRIDSFPLIPAYCYWVVISSRLCKVVEQKMSFYRTPNKLLKTERLISYWKPKLWSAVRKWSAVHCPKDRYTLSSSFPPQSGVYSVFVVFLEGYVVLSVLVLAVCKLLYLIFGQCTVLHFLTADRSFGFQ